MRLNNLKVEPGIYPNFCAKNPVNGTICGMKIYPGEWKHEYDFVRASVFYHPKRDVYRILMAAGPLLIVADTKKIASHNQLYVDTAYDQHRNVPPIVYHPFFRAVYAWDKPKHHMLHGKPTHVRKSFFDVLYDGEYIHTSHKKYRAPHLGELISLSEEELVFSHGKAHVSQGKLIIEWKHEPPKEPPGFLSGSIVTWY